MRISEPPTDNGAPADISVKRPLLYIAAPFALGIASSEALAAAQAGLFCAAAALYAAAFLLSRRVLLSHIALYLALFLTGALYYQSAITLPAEHISRYAPERRAKVMLKGEVLDDPVASPGQNRRIRTSFVMRVESIRCGDIWRAARGLIDVGVYTRGEATIGFGQKIIAEGLLSKPVGLKNPGLFDYPRYLAGKGIYAVFRVGDGSRMEIMDRKISNPVKAVAYSLRRRMRSAIDRNLEPPYSNFIKAIMIGDRAGLERGLNDDFVKTGTVHAIAISGLNVGLIAAICLGAMALMGLPKNASLVLSACVMVIYAFIAGSNPPIVRAVIIYVVIAAGYLISRKTDMLNSLAFAALVMLLANPAALFDPSFQLSFASIAGMIMITPKVNGLFRVKTPVRGPFVDRARHYILGALSVSIAATLATWPITARYFNITSFVALAANLAVVPALFLLTAASFVLLIADIVSGALAGLVAHCISLICGAVFSSNHLLASLPLAYARIAAPSNGFIVIYYAALLILTATSSGGSTWPRIRRAWLIIASLAVINMMVWTGAHASGRGALRITFIDVGQGDSALVELPGGGNMLIDAGPGGDDGRFDAARSVIAPFLWNRGINRLDAIIVTHFHEDHLGGVVYLLENFKVGRVMDNGARSNGSAIFNRYLRAVKDKRIIRETIGRGDVIDIDDVRIYVLNPDKRESPIDSNENSVVLKICRKDFGALLCGDADEFALKDMADIYGNFLKCDIIKIPHHGGGVGSRAVFENFIRASGADTAVISVAKVNKYGVPSKKILNIIRENIPVVYQTGDSGAVGVYVSGALRRVSAHAQGS